MLESDYMIHGTSLEKSIKIVDKSKRAFDTSVDSTRALELAIQKDVKTCSYSFTRLKSIFYSAWILLFKAHGSAPSK